MFSSFKGPANVRDKQPVFESFGERQFANFDETKHAPAPVWNVHSQAYNNVRIYPGDQLNIKLQTLTAHNQTVIPEQRPNAHSNSLQCPYPNNSQTVLRPTAVINCHTNGASCCGHPNRVPHHWNTVPPNVPPPRHFVDNISLYNNHNNLNSEDYRFRTDTYYAPINKQVLSHRDNPVVNQPSYYPGPLRNVPGVAPVYDLKLPPPLPVTNRAVGKYTGNKVPRTEPCAKCSGNCSENCELYGGQDIVDYSGADTPNEFVRENVPCYSGLHAESAGPASQYCTQWATSTNSQTEYCRQNNNAAMWVHNSHSAISGNNLASNCWIDKKDLLPGNCLSQYTSHHPGGTQQSTRQKDTQDSLKLPVNDVSCMQTPQLINAYPEVLHQDKEKVYNGNFCNHVPGRRADETPNKINGPYFKEREVVHSQTVPQFSHLKQIKHDFSLNGAPSIPQERVIFQEPQTFTSSVGSHPVSVPSFAQPNALHPYNKNATKSCFQNTGSGQLHAQDVTANSFSLSKVTEAFTTGIAQPPSRFSSHLTYTQSRISKANNEFSYFQEYDSSAHLASNSGTANPAIPSVSNSLSPKMNPVSTSTCASESQPIFSSSDDSKIVTNTLHPATRNEHIFNRNADYNISDLQSCKRVQENNITGKLMQVIDASTSNVNIGIRECTGISSNDASNIMVKNISSYNSEYNIYPGNIPSGSGTVSYNTSTGNVDFTENQMLTNFDPYSKQFGPGPVLNAGDGPDVLSSSGPVISSLGESEIAASNKVIQPDFGTDKFYEATENPQMKRNLSHVGSVMKSEYRTPHSVKQKCQKVGQLDVRQFLATWDEETEDVASPRLPDVVLSSNGTPLFVVECGGGNLSEISPVATNSTNEEAVRRSGVIVYEHIQSINSSENVTDHTHTDHVSNRNAELLVNVTDDPGALGNDCILLESSISDTETVQSNLHTSESNINIKQQVQKTIALTDGQINKEESSLCLIENRSPVDSTEIILQNSDCINSVTRETLSPTISTHSKESVSDPQGIHSKDKGLLAEKTSILNTAAEKNEEKQSCDVLQGTSVNFLQKTDSVSPGINYDTKNVCCEPLHGHVQDVKKNESDFCPEASSGTKHFSNEVMTSSRNNNLDDIAADAFEELTNVKRGCALKCRYSFSNVSTRTNICADDDDDEDCSCASGNEKKLFGNLVYPNSPHQCNSRSDVIEPVENKNDAGRSEFYIDNASICNRAHEQNTNVDKCTLTEHSVMEVCSGKNVKETILERSCQNLCSINYRTLQYTMGMKNKGIIQCVDEVPQCRSDEMISINTGQLTTTMQRESNIHVKRNTKCDYETVTVRHKREVNGNCTSSFVTDKYEILETHLSIHNPFCPLEIAKGTGKLSPNCMSSAKRCVSNFSSKPAVMNHMWQSSDKSIGNILPNLNRVQVARLSSNESNLLSATATTVNEMISVSCKCLFSKQSVSESAFTIAGTKSFLLPVDLLLDRATMYLIRRKLFSGKHLKIHNHCIKGTLDSSKNRFLTNDRTFCRKGVLQRSTEYSHHRQLWNERAHGSGQMNARFSFASHASRCSPAGKVQCGNRFVTIFGDYDENGLSLFLKQYSQDDNLGNYNTFLEALKTLVQQRGKGRACCRRQCLRPAVSSEYEEEPGAQMTCNIARYQNLPEVSNSPLLFIDPDVFQDECIQGQSVILQDLESTSIFFKITDSCLNLLLHHLGYNDHTHTHRNVSSIKFQDVPGFEEFSACTNHEKNLSKFEATCFNRNKMIDYKLLKNIETTATACTASTTRNKSLLIQEQTNSSEEMSCVYDRKVYGNNSVTGNDDKLTALLSIKNNVFGGNYQWILSTYLLKSLHCHRIVTGSDSTNIRKLNSHSSKQKDPHHNSESVSPERSSIASRQVITEVTTYNQELLPSKSYCREIDADCQDPTEEENSLLSNKGSCNDVSHSEEGKPCFVIETTSSNSFLNDAVSGVVRSALPYSKNIIIEKCPVLIPHDTDTLHNNDSAVTPNSTLALTEMCSCSQQQVSGVSPQKINKVGSKTQNSKLELADESEVVISSTSTLEEANTDIDCNFNDKEESLFLFEDELPCVESYVDADDVTVVSGTHDAILDEENGIDVPCVVVYPESHENVLHSEGHVGAHISSVDVCSESDVITAAIISDDVCMNSNCVIVSEDESSRQSPQNLLMDIGPCSTQEDTVEFRRFSTECTDEYQNSTVSSTTHINELADSNSLKSMNTVLLREDRENQNITTSDMHGDFSFFGEEIDYYNTGVLQADSVSDWPYLEEEVISELQNSDVEPEVPLGNTICEINSDKSQSLSCSPPIVNNVSMKNDLQCQNPNMEESSNSSKTNSAKENYTQADNELIDLKCRLSWDKIFDLSRKDKCSGYKMKNRTRKTVTKSWPYYCKTQSRWKWPKSKDKLYRKVSKKSKEMNILSDAKKQKHDFMGQCFERNTKKISGTSQFDKTETSIYRSPPNSSSLKHNMWHVTNENNSNPCGYKREKNNNYVIESVDNNAKSDIVSNPIVLVQRLILKRNRDHTDLHGKNRVDKNYTFSGHASNDEKASCSNPYKQGICKSETLDPKNSTGLSTHRVEQSFVEVRGKQGNIEDSYSKGTSKCHDNNDRTINMFKADSISGRKKSKSFSVEVQHVKHSKETKTPNDKSVKKNSGECLKELPRVIIKRSPDGSTRYKSFLCLSAATEKYWQPIVMLKRDSNIEELAKRMQKRKYSHHIVDGSSQSNLEISSEITGKVHKIKYKDNMHATGKKNNGNEHERGAIDTCITTQKKIIRRKEKNDLSEFKKSKYSDTSSLSISSYDSFRTAVEESTVPDEQIELRCASVCHTVPSKSGKRCKVMIKHDKDERDKDYKRIHSECQELFSNNELPSKMQSDPMFSDTEVTNISVSTSGENNRKHFINMCESKHNCNESSHTSNNEERQSLLYSSSRDEILKKKCQEQQRSEKNSKKRRSELADSKSATKKKCFWDSDYTKSVQVTSRSPQKCTNITVFSNKESHFPVHHRDEMTTPNARCSLIDRQVSLQNDELETYKSSDCNTVDQDGGKINCQACGIELKTLAERSSHIRQHPYHCQRCHLAFRSEGDFVNHLSLEHPQTKEQHHCLLCEKSFSTSDKHQMHLQGRLHRYVELTQRRTIHTIFTLLTGRACPGLPPLTDAEMEGIGWFPSEPGTVHFYHQATPLQMAVQGWLNYQRNKSESGITEENKRSELKNHSQ